METEFDISDDVFELFKKGLNVFSELRDTAKIILSEAKVSDPDLGNFAQAQLYYLGERCQTASLLMQHGKLWDTEIVMRSVLECATRQIFVTIANPIEQGIRIREYWYDLAEVSDISRSEKAKNVVTRSKDAEITMLVGGVVLPEKQEQDLREKWPKKKRVALNQKWSFSEMVREISKFYNDELDFRDYPSLLHGYCISSHLIHADQTAINLVWDRGNREKHRKELLISAHAARLITDQSTFLLLCIRALAWKIRSKHNYSQAVSNYFELMRAAEKFHTEFADSERFLYV